MHLAYTHAVNFFGPVGCPAGGLPATAVCPDDHRGYFIFWKHYIYETFADLKYTKKAVFKRKRALMLQMPIEDHFTLDELVEVTADVAKRYATVGRPTILRDLKELQELGLLRKEGRMYIANTRILKAMRPEKKPENSK